MSVTFLYHGILASVEKQQLTVQSFRCDCSYCALATRRRQVTSIYEFAAFCSLRLEEKRHALAFGFLPEPESYAVNCFLLCKARIQLYKGSSLPPFLGCSRTQSQLAVCPVNGCFPRMEIDPSHEVKGSFSHNIICEAECAKKDASV